MNEDWVAFFDGTEDRDLRPFFERATQAAGPPPADGVALELGCGSGIETLALLRAGWRVTAMDASAEGIRRTQARAVEAGLADRLTAQAATFETYVPTPADFVYAGASLPFCDPAAFPRVWDGIRGALRPGGLLAVHLFGVNDTWADQPAMNFHTAAGARALVDGLELVRFEEDENDGDSFMGPKHWHTFEVFARRPGQ